MSSGRGLIRGFLVGVFLTMILAGGIGYVIYKRVETAISPESVRESAEETLARIMGGKVQVRSGEIGLPNLLTLSDVSLSDGHGKMISFDRVELIAEGGVQGLQEGRFGQVILTNPTISLQRIEGKWNLVEYLQPLLSASQKKSASSPLSASAEQKPLPLKLVQITGLDFQVTLGDGEVYSGIDADEVTLSREDLDSPWAIHCKSGRLRLNPTAEEWPLFETYDALVGLLADNQVAESSPGRSLTGEPWNSPTWLGDVIMDGFDLEFIHPNQHLTLSGLSMQADEMFEFIRLQTGNLEKKTPHPKA